MVFAKTYRDLAEKVRSDARTMSTSNKIAILSIAENYEHMARAVEVAFAIAKRSGMPQV
jgi:hypothetical protein